MRRTTAAAEGPYYAIRVVDCSDDHRSWSPPEVATATQLVLVRRGRFHLRARGLRTTVDPTSGYLLPSGHEARFSHPAGGDTCTSIILSGESFSDGVDRPATPAVRVDARLELAHRLLLRDHEDHGFAGLEALLHLVQLAARREPDETPPPGRHALADRARDAILADEPSSNSLVALAGLLQTSPAHLSRTFGHHVGMSVSRYRNRVLISRALQRLDEGATDIAGLAVSLGFSDQAHFTRTMRRELGHTPRQVRTLLAPSE